jgi:hypothetical protein
MAVVLATDWIVGKTEKARVGRAKGKEVHHLDATEAPASREALAAADRRIVAAGAGR